MIKKLTATMLLICLIPTIAFSQTSAEPVPWGPDDFAPWQKDLRRAGIIAFGALPFVTMIGSLVYDILRYYQNDRQEGYLPWPLKNQQTAVPFSENEQKTILITAAGLSIGVAVTDFVVRYVRRQRQGKHDPSVSPGIIFIEQIDTTVDAEESDQSEWVVPEIQDSPEYQDGPEQN